MKQPSNVRCYLPKSEAAKLLTVFLQLHDIAETPPYNATDDFARSIDLAYELIRERMANGGPGWTQKEYKPR